MTDRILIEGLRLSTRIGVTAAERSSSQPITVSVAIHTSTERAAKSDELGETVDYGAIVEGVTELAAAGERKLLERLAEEIAALIVAVNGVDHVTVKVVKEEPPLTAEVREIAVEIERAGR